MTADHRNHLNGAMILMFVFSPDTGQSLNKVWIIDKYRSFVITVASGVVLCGDRKIFHVALSVVKCIFHIWPFDTSEDILRTQTIIITGIPP